MDQEWLMTLYLHPMFVHFPIAFLLLESLIAIRYVMTKKKPLLNYSAFLVRASFTILFVTIATGIYDSDGWENILSEGIREHAIVSCVLFVIVLIRFFLIKQTFNKKYLNFYLILSFIGSAFVLWSANLGGKLVYG